MQGLPGCGIAFELSPGSSDWTEKILYTFTGSADGGVPEAGLTMDKAESLRETNRVGHEVVREWLCSQRE